MIKTNIIANKIWLSSENPPRVNHTLLTVIGGGSGGDVSPPKFQVGFLKYFSACHPGGRCCVPRVPLPNNVNDVRKLSGKKMGGSPPPPPLISFFGSCASDFILSQAWRARKNHARPPLNFCASAANANSYRSPVTQLFKIFPLNWFSFLFMKKCDIDPKH